MRSRSQYLTPLSPRMLDELTYAATRGRYGATVACPRVTRDALISRGMLTEATATTQWQNYLTPTGWAYLTRQGIITGRPEDPNRHTLAEALTEAYPEDTVMPDPHADLEEAARDRDPHAHYTPGRDGYAPIWTDTQHPTDTDTAEDTDHE